MERPSPKPFFFVVKNGSNNSARSASALRRLLQQCEADRFSDYLDL